MAPVLRGMDSGLAASRRPGMTSEVLWNARRFSEAGLHAVSSRNMYSEHGFDALIRPLAGQVCQSLIVVSNCSPGSAEAQAACAILSHNTRAGRVLVTAPSVRRVSCQSLPDSTRSRNSLATRTVLFAFSAETLT